MKMQRNAISEAHCVIILERIVLLATTPYSTTERRIHNHNLMINSITNNGYQECAAT